VNDSANDTKDGRGADDRGLETGRRDLLKYASGGVGLAMMAGLGGCISNITGGGGPYKAGIHLPLSQGYSVLGESFINALELARDEINEDGGIAGRDLEFVIEDNEVDPGTGVEKANKLIRQDNVDVILGPVNSSMRNALAPIMEENEVPMMYWMSYEGPTAEDYCNEYIFKFGEVPVQQWEPAVPWFMDEFGDSFYLIGKDDSYSRILHDVVTETVESEGGEVVGNDFAPINHTDFSSILSKVESEDPDVLYMTVVGKSVGAIQKQLFNRGMRESYAEVGSGHGPINLAGTAPEHANGVYNSLAYHQGLRNSANQEFVSKFQEENGDDALITAWTGLAYNCLKMFGTAMQDAVSGSADEVLSNLPDASIDGVIGEADVGKDHQINLSCNILQVNENIQFETVKELPRNQPEETCSGF
jgi:urea transport system substrate-binding protein